MNLDPFDPNQIEVVDLRPATVCQPQLHFKPEPYPMDQHRDLSAIILIFVALLLLSKLGLTLKGKVC